MDSAWKGFFCTKFEGHEGACTPPAPPGGDPVHAAGFDNGVAYMKGKVAALEVRLQTARDTIVRQSDELGSLRGDLINAVSELGKVRRLREHNLAELSKAGDTVASQAKRADTLSAELAEWKRRALQSEAHCESLLNRIENLEGQIVCQTSLDTAAKIEREACASICDNFQQDWVKVGNSTRAEECEECAAAIRARGEVKS